MAFWMNRCVANKVHPPRDMYASILQIYDIDFFLLAANLFVSNFIVPKFYTDSILQQDYLY